MKDQSATGVSSGTLRAEIANFASRLTIRGMVMEEASKRISSDKSACYVVARAATAFLTPETIKSSRKFGTDVPARY